MAENQLATEEVLDNVVETPVEVEEKSMDDTIRDTLRDLQEKGATVEPASAPLDDVEKAAKIRDDKGKFAKKEVIDTIAVIAPELQSVAEPAPNTWKKEAQAEWAKLPPNVREEVQRREADFHKGIEQYKTQAQYGDTMQRTIAPYMATIDGFGVTPDVAVKELLSSDHTLRYGNEQQKVNMVFKIFRDYGISPQSVFNQLQNGAPQVNPEIAALQQQLGQLQGTLKQQETMQKQQEQAALDSEIASFAADPSHKHFESVKGHMSALLQAEQAKDLQDAYEQAIYANPTTRALVLAEQQNKVKEEATLKAQQAKTVASINVKPRPSMPVSQPIGSMEDTIRSTLRRLNAS